MTDTSGEAESPEEKLLTALGRGVTPTRFELPREFPGLEAIQMDLQMVVLRQVRDGQMQPDVAHELLGGIGHLALLAEAAGVKL